MELLAQSNDDRMLISQRETARLLGVTDRTVFSLRKSGELPFIKLGSRVLFSRDDLAAFVAKKRQIATPAAA